MGIYMQIEQKKAAPEHSVTMSNRRIAVLTGVSEVRGFSDAAVELETCMGGLIIKGRELTINKLNTDTGELNVNGQINSIQYSAKKKEGLFAGLFK